MFEVAYLQLVLEKTDLEVERERGGQDSHSLFVGLQLSTQAKKCEMRPHPVSEEKEVEGLDQGEKVHVVNKCSAMEIS